MPKPKKGTLSRVLDQILEELPPIQRGLAVTCLTEAADCCEIRGPALRSELELHQISAVWSFFATITSALTAETHRIANKQKRAILSPQSVNGPFPGTTTRVAKKRAKKAKRR